MCRVDNEQTTLEIHQTIVKLHRFGVDDVFAIARAAGFLSHRDVKFQQGLRTLLRKEWIRYGDSPRAIRLTSNGLEMTPWPRPKTNKEAQQELFEWVKTNNNLAPPEILEKFWKALTKGRKYKFSELARSMAGKELHDSSESYRGMEKMTQRLADLGAIEWKHGHIMLTDLAFPHGRKL